MVLRSDRCAGLRAGRPESQWEAMWEQRQGFIRETDGLILPSSL